MPFSIEPLPDGTILLSERMRGLRIISPDGSKSSYINGTPKVYDDSGIFLGQVQGLGWMLDVKKDPDYEKNGWIYIHHTDRCTGCNELSKKSNAPVSMNRIVRGRIRDGNWVDEEILWQADYETYTNTSDLAAGGRLAFDANGHLYFSVGIKDTLDFMGIQDLDKPYGKIHRINSDGSIPQDNPFLKVPGALPTIWTLGHRSVQGLEYNPATGDMWTTEMGPRGGDELNRLGKGGNYGWPVYTTGVNYDGRPVNVADKLGIELAKKDAVFPIVDWTPAIAASGFIFYERHMNSPTGTAISSSAPCAPPTCCAWKSRTARSRIRRCCSKTLPVSGTSNRDRTGNSICWWRTRPVVRSSGWCQFTRAYLYCLDAQMASLCRMDC